MEAHMNCRPHGHVLTTWKVGTAAVSGDAHSEYEIGSIMQYRIVELNIPQVMHNPGTFNEWVEAYPTDAQIKEVLGVTCCGRICLTPLYGNELELEVFLPDGYPLGEMSCTSHITLSPVAETTPKRNSFFVWKDKESAKLKARIVQLEEENSLLKRSLEEL